MRKNANPPHWESEYSGPWKIHIGQCPWLGGIAMVSSHWLPPKHMTEIICGSRRETGMRCGLSLWWNRSWVARAERKKKKRKQRRRKKIEKSKESSKGRATRASWNRKTPSRIACPATSGSPVNRPLSYPPNRLACLALRS